MASEIPEIVYALGPQLKAFMAVGILLKYFAVTCSSLSEDSAKFRYVPLYIADQVEFRCSFSSFFTRTSHTGSPSSKYVVYATACIYRELYGKITDRKKILCK